MMMQMQSLMTSSSRSSGVQGGRRTLFFVSAGKDVNEIIIIIEREL